MPHHDIVVVGASAGGLEPLAVILGRLPPTLEVCVLIAVHTRSEGNGALATILGRKTAWPVAFACDGDRVAHRRVFVAPPDCHLLVSGNRLRVTRGPKENGFRPAIDPLFRTAARSFGSRVVGIILSGALSDGAYGLSVIRSEGGVAIVQEPDEALIPSMPRSALHAVDGARVLRASQIAAALERLTTNESEPGGLAMRRSDDLEPQLVGEETEVGDMKSRYGAASALTCPDCGGALWEVQRGRVVRYQCHVGHQYAPDNLEAEQRSMVDGALWTAVRVLEEQAELKMRIASRTASKGAPLVSKAFARDAMQAHEQAQHIRSLLMQSAPTDTADDRDAGTRSSAGGRPARPEKARRKRVSSSGRRMKR